jgi:hypothetical protein
MDSVQLVVAPTYDQNGRGRIVIGFHNEHFSQCVNLPFTNYDDAFTLADELKKSILKAAEELLAPKVAQESQS